MRIAAQVANVCLQRAPLVLVALCVAQKLGRCNLRVAALMADVEEKVLHRPFDYIALVPPRVPVWNRFADLLSARPMGGGKLMHCCSY
jgi:hypothetical protein